MEPQGGMFSEMDKNSDAKKWFDSFSRFVPEKPKSILVISAHWEDNPISITTRPTPTLLYDYYGFPDYTSKITSPVPHSPQLVERMKTLLSDAKIDFQEDSKRGLDHGVFVPLKLMYPDADIPVVQLSLNPSLNPEFHFKVGKALSQLRYEGCLIIGSGFIVHNMQSFFDGNMNWAKDWIEFVKDSLTNPSYDAEKRKQLMFNWKSHKLGKKAHPREEHLVPIFVTMGTNDGGVAEQVYDKPIVQIPFHSFKFV